MVRRTVAVVMRLSSFCEKQIVGRLVSLAESRVSVQLRRLLRSPSLHHSALHCTGPWLRAPLTERYTRGSARRALRPSPAVSPFLAHS